MHRVEQGLERALPGPAVGQVEGEPAGRTGQAGRHVDRTVTDGRAGRTGVEGAGEGPAGAGEVEGERGGVSQAAFAWKFTEVACANGPFFNSEIACSTMACRR